MERREMMFLVQPVVDKAFKNSYWGYDVPSTLGAAFEAFSSQFEDLGVVFETLPIERWSKRLRIPPDYPRALLSGLPDGSTQEMVVHLVRKLNKLFSKVETISSERERELTEELEKMPKDDQLMYLAGYLEGALYSILREDLERYRSVADIVIGFTGEFLAYHGLTTKPMPELEFLGQAFPLEKVILMTPCVNPQEVLLHEIGHIFGATHVEDVESVMKVGETETFEFDSENKERIRKTLMQILEGRRGQSA